MPEITRRTFLGGAAATSVSLVVGCTGARPAKASATAGAHEFGPWIEVGGDGRVHVLSDKVEMGQGVLTMYATLVGEELDTSPTRLVVRHADADPRYGPMQNTGGSNSASTRWEKVRLAGAEVRERLCLAAAQEWGVERESVRCLEGEIVHDASGRRAHFGTFVEAAARLDSPADVRPKDANDFRFIGHDGVRIDAVDKARGAARYGMDVQEDGLRVASVLRPPVRGDRIASYDAEAARAVPGVEVVVEIPTGVAVVASHTWAARKGVEALAPTFAAGEGPRPDSAQIRADHERLLDEEDGREARDEGNARKTIERAAKRSDVGVVDVVYHTPHQAHATMEPLNCTIAPRADGTVDVHVGAQSQQIVQDAVAGALGVDREAVRVHIEMLGGTFGRRIFADVLVECAEIVKRAGGPIKLVWSREDDNGHDYYRPASSHRFRAAVGGDGRITAWDHHLVVASLMPSMAKGMAGALAPQALRGVANAVGETVAGWVPRLVGPVLALEGASTMPYAVDNVRVATTVHDPGVRVGIWRSVGHSNTGFVVESFVDELAHAAGEDPLAFRRKHLAEHPRHLACLELVERIGRWGRQPEGRFQGVAVHESFGSVVAHLAEVSVDGTDFRVERVTAAVHCGRAINPDVVRAQIAGGTNFGLTAALKSAITFVDGVPEQKNFDSYPMLRNHEAPQIDVHIVPSDDAPTGVGEPGTPAIAAAVANALYVATGQRLREMPLRLEA